MAIVSWPDNVHIHDRTLCAICGQDISLLNATIGREYVDGGHTFVCDRHSLKYDALIASWADFEMEQERQKTAPTWKLDEYPKEGGHGHEPTVR